MPFESTRSCPSFELAVIAIGLAATPDGAAVDDADGAEVGEDDDTVPLDEPHAARTSAADAASATAPPNRSARAGRFPRVPRVVDNLVLMTISSTS
jgi:hypothetical protein